MHPFIQINTGNKNLNLKLKSFQQECSKKHILSAKSGQQTRCDRLVDSPSLKAMADPQLPTWWSRCDKWAWKRTIKLLENDTEQQGPFDLSQQWREKESEHTFVTNSWPPAVGAIVTELSKARHRLHVHIQWGIKCNEPKTTVGDMINVMAVLQKISKHIKMCVVRETGFLHVLTTTPHWDSHAEQFLLFLLLWWVLKYCHEKNCKNQSWWWQCNLSYDICHIFFFWRQQQCPWSICLGVRAKHPSRNNQTEGKLNLLLMPQQKICVLRCISIP